ncbi:MAG TPA: DUF1361 domain-containing protein [Candidatus Nitrosopolaris sp.]|nr:DUF1361 domain-containing protein [Candidatus Nitrosopolaris sp.]
MLVLRETEKRYLQAMGLLSGLCLAFFVVRVILTDSSSFDFIPGNLVLAWLGLVFGWLLIRQLKVTRWASWQNISLSVLWLFFLPNTWYMLTDFIHVYPTGEISELYDIAMIGSLVITGFILGFTSLYLVHKELFKRFGAKPSAYLVAGVILLSSFAIYLGRDLRWNSWDVIANPSGLILNVSDRIIDPLGHLRAFNVTGLFFVLISVLYTAVWLVFRPAKK